MDGRPQSIGVRAELGAIWADRALGGDRGQSMITMVRLLALLWAVASAGYLVSEGLAPNRVGPGLLITGWNLVGVAAAAGLAMAAEWIGRRQTLDLVHGLFVLTILGSGVTALSGSGPATVIAAANLVWISVFAFAFFPWRAAGEYMALEAVICVAVLVARKVDAVAIAPVLIGPALGAGVVVGYMSSRLRRTALLDPLTGLPNRQAIEVLLEHEVERISRDGGRLSVAILDLDRFKEVNDLFGHHEGDRVLSEVADRWHSSLPQGHVLGRYAGDEFVAVLRDCSPQDTFAVLDKVRVAGGYACSVGAVHWRPGDTSDVLLTRADSALYAAKNEGRDRVAIFCACWSSPSTTAQAP